MSSESSEDPYCVCVHVLCEEGKAGHLQAAANRLLSLLRPELLLLRVSERGPYRPRPHPRQTPPTLSPDSPHQPALALILFLHESHTPSLQHLQGNLCRPPWRYHHTERVQTPCLSPATHTCQDFYTLGAGTPLWALRQVHYGKEVLRLTVYCRFHSYGAMVRLYRLLVAGRRMTRREDGFCFCVLYSSTHTQVQLSLKRLPRGRQPVAMDSALLEFRVPDVGGIIPLLPHPCTPISSQRWYTHDFDNNKILLQVPVRTSRCQTLVHAPHDAEDHTPLVDHTSCPSPSPVAPPSSVPLTGRGPASYRNRRYQRKSAPHTRTQTLPPTRPHPQSHNPLRGEESGVCPNPTWAWRRARSLSALPTHAAPPPFRLNVAALLGAPESDVDTGRRLSGSHLDLSVVSAYSRPRPLPQRSLSQSRRTAVPQAGSPAPGPPSAPPTKGSVSMTTSVGPAPHLPQARTHSHTHTVPHTHHKHSHTAAHKEDEQEFYI
ncbi:hypothetical protein ACEWY4_000005 [Coilia grayii]|uniref:FAM124 domain-containing protein n=1 Tax=Coilia grayii TaxID=363190 RepID=A0ABD1KVG7_9TELE